MPRGSRGGRACSRLRMTEQFSLTSSFDRWEELYCALLSRNAREPAIHRVPVPSLPVRIR
jgi:hypothetical protein